MAHRVCEPQMQWRPLPGPGLLGMAAAQVQNQLLPLRAGESAWKRGRGVQSS